ncbi:MAG: hypothetical protein PVF75_09945 [Granulosicoccaceae bacterium]|jgi:hypothetical protein
MNLIGAHKSLFTALDRVASAGVFLPQIAARSGVVMPREQFE